MRRASPACGPSAVSTRSGGPEIFTLVSGQLLEIRISSCFVAFRESINARRSLVHSASTMMFSDLHRMNSKPGNNCSLRYKLPHPLAKGADEWGPELTEMAGAAPVRTRGHDQLRPTRQACRSQRRATGVLPPLRGRLLRLGRAAVTCCSAPAW